MNKVLVFGDQITDRYHQCRATRICPEAPVPVLVKDGTYDTLGGACLVTGNLRSLGFTVAEVTGSRSLKERFYVNGHLICRVDADSQAVYNCDEALQVEVKRCDAVVISDYCKGAVTTNAIDILIGSGKPVFVDTKDKPELYRGSNVTIFPNVNEVESKWSGVWSQSNLFRAVVEKLGADGARISDEHRKEVHIPTRKRQSYDVTGAGDCFIAAYVYAYMRGLDPLSCVQVANEAAGVSVEHTGTYIVKPADLKSVQYLFDVAEKVAV